FDAERSGVGHSRRHDFVECRAVRTMTHPDAAGAPQIRPQFFSRNMRRFARAIISRSWTCALGDAWAVCSRYRRGARMAGAVLTHSRADHPAPSPKSDLRDSSGRKASAAGGDGDRKAPIARDGSDGKLPSPSDEGDRKETTARSESDRKAPAAGGEGERKSPTARDGSDGKSPAPGREGDRKEKAARSEGDRKA